MLHRNFGRDLAGVVFGLWFQAVCFSLIGGILVFASALWGVISLEWMIRVGILLQLMGLMLLVMEYAGLSQDGPSPLRWWVRSHTAPDSSGHRPETWPGQMAVIVAVGAIVAGLVLQLTGSFL